MLLPEEDSEVFKRWVLPKLETISDADAEVLADYVVALVTTKDTDANIRRNCLESLSDFLQDNTAPFVDEVIRTLKDKSYAPRPHMDAPTEAPVPIPSIVGSSTSEYLPDPAHAFNAAPLHAPKGPAASRYSSNQHRLPDRPTGAFSGAGAQQEPSQRSRKRKQNERDTSQSRDHTGTDRPVKQAARRGGKNGRGGALNAQAPAFAPMPNIPLFNPGFGEVPPFDPSNPMAFLAMAAAFGINLPGMPPLPTLNAHGASNIRCADYDAKGFCAAGSMCPYQHGLEYDPDQPAQGLDGGSGFQPRFYEDRGYKGRSVGRSRAPFSLPGPTHDRTNTTIVVEQIPEGNFSEGDVRDFFGKFGTILDVRMQAYKRLAIVKYETHEAASAAYKSPKVIFDNRFVKVYWHRSDTDLGPSYHHNGFDAEGEEGSYGDGEMLDPEEIERRQAEAQRAFEERRKKAEEAAVKAEEIDRKLQETNAEILRVRRELAKVSGGADGDMEEDMSQDLATLQAEAENLFAQQDAAASSWHSSTRGAYRGDHRGRGHAGRARGFRGNFHGRGAFSGARTSVKRLDNRPRRIAIKDVEPGTRKDEALRQHLFNVPDLLATHPHPENPTTLILTFAERYQAESFIDAAHTIPDVGTLEMEWVPNDAFGGVQASGVDAIGGVEGGGGEDREGEGRDSDGEGDVDGDGDGDGEAAGEEEEGNKNLADVDMDVAEDEDQWL